MQSSGTPDRVPLPFADSGARNTIPTPSQIAVKAGAASLTDGFPPLTRTPLVSGGQPPFGEDMNGILWLLSANTRWFNAGGAAVYDAAFATAVGGYPRGARLYSPIDGLLYVNRVEGNTTEPGSASSAGWSGNFLTVTVYPTPGTYSYTVPLGVYTVRLRVVGGGGGGGRCSTTGGSAGNQSGSGGGAGGYAEGIYNVVPGQQISITVGAGGTTELAGGTSTFGSLIGATGGMGGRFQASSASAGGSPGLGFGGNIVLYGAPGSDGQSGPLCFAGNGGNSIFGGGGRAGDRGGTVGWAPGAGGGGSYDASNGGQGSGGTYSGGAGAAGCVIIENLIGVAA